MSAALDQILRRSEVAWRGLDALRPDPSNARTHSKKQVDQLAGILRRLGVMNPIVHDETGLVICGHARLLAARKMALKQVPCILVEGLSQAEKAALALADNKIAANAGWDPGNLADQLQLAMAEQITIEEIGFEIPEIELILEEQKPKEEPGDPRDDRLPALASGPPVSRPGDLWLLGPHKLLCGDATNRADFAALLGEEKAEMVFVDPPYNVRIAGHARGRNSGHHEFPMASGEMSSAQFTGFLRASFDLLAAFSRDGAIHFVCMDWRHLSEVLSAGGGAFTELKNLCVWVKDNGGMGSFYRSRHELVLVFKSGASAHVNTFELGQHGRYRTNVWEYAGANTRKRGRREELALHPTVKPAAMVADAIKDVSHPGGLVLDCFGGSGTTLIAAHKTGRRARLMELDPIYVDRIVRRWQELAKDEAEHAETGASFAALAARRRADNEAGRP